MSATLFTVGAVGKDQCPNGSVPHTLDRSRVSGHPSKVGWSNRSLNGAPALRLFPLSPGTDRCSSARPARLLPPPEPRGIRPPKTPNSDRRRPPTSPNMCESSTEEMPFPGQVIGPSQVPISAHLRASSRQGTLTSTTLLRHPRTVEASPSGDGEARDEVPPGP